MDLLVGAALIAFTGYISTLSYALRSYSRSRLAAHMSESQQQRWLSRLDSYEADLALLASLGRLLGILALSIFVYYAFVKHFSGGFPPGWSTSDILVPPMITLAVLAVIGLAIPQSIANYAGESALARSLGLLWAARVVCYPAIKLLLWVDFVVRRLLGQPDTSDEQETDRVEQEILEAVDEGELTGAVDEEQSEMIRSIFELHETTVSEIMTPRTDVVALPADASFDQARETIVKAGHSRIPVYENSLDNIIGVLYAKDLLKLAPGAPFNLRDSMRTAPFVPETKTLDALLDEFRSKKVQIAIVLDEYGGTSGLCTIEDILEELVGEIDDEYDQRPAPSIERIDEDTLDVDARVPIYEINEHLSISLPEDEDYDTIGGFVFSTLGRIPEQGDEFEHLNLRFNVVDAEPRKINRLRIHVKREPQPA